MDLLESQDLVVIVVKDDSEDIKPLSSGLEAFKENSPFFSNTNGKKCIINPFDSVVKIDNFPKEISDTEACQNTCEEILSKTKRKDTNIILNGDLCDMSLIKEEAKYEIEVEKKSSILTNQDSLYKSLNEFYIGKEQRCEEEIEYLEEEYDEACNLEDSEINILEYLPAVRHSYISDLKLQFPELKKDEELLIEVVARIMKELKHPSVPQKYYVQRYDKFKCNLCRATTVTLPAAERHYLEKHGSRYLVCYACGANFRSRGNLYRHEKKACKAEDIDIVLKARAMFLGKKGTNRPYLDMYQSAWSSSASKNVPKNICKNVVKNVGKITIKPPHRYLCTICPTSYVTKKALESHMNKHLGRRPYHCNKCSNAYSGPNALKQHAESHENILFICDICKRSFKWKGSLIGHMNTHLPTKKYGCPDCDRRFAKSLSLTHHINRVHKKLPYAFSCQICPKRYSSMFILKQHMKKEHGLNIMSRATYIRRLPQMSEQDVLKAKIVLSSDLASKDPVFLNH